MRKTSRTLCCCFPLLVLCCCFQFPSSFSSSDAVHVGDANFTNFCNSSSSTQCANLGNISYPFWGSAACAASPSYVFSNCTPSSTAAYWDSLSPAAQGVAGSPVVTAVDQGQHAAPIMHATVELSWNKSLVDLGSCPPLFPSANLSLYNIPSSIDLTRFADSSALSFTNNNAILLFDCAHNSSQFLAEAGIAALQVESDTSGCTLYRRMCRIMEETLCIQWKINMSSSVLEVQHVLDTLACSHFMFGIPSTVHDDLYTPPRYTAYTPAVFELLWTDTQCYNCSNIAGGHCVGELAFPAKFSHCECSNGSVIDFNTERCNDDFVYSCYGGSIYCSTGAKVGVGVVALVGVLLILILLKLGFPRLSKVTVPVVISILKNILRKLQSISHMHNLYLDLLDLNGLTERPIEYTYSSLASATKSFSSVLGEGGFGTVYKGTLTMKASKRFRGGSKHGLKQAHHIAVKVLESKSKHSNKQFLNEVVTIGKIHHVNVVRLLGFCLQEEHEMLVYEFMVNGSLDKWLFNKKGNPQQRVLNWGQRCAIALGVARGLSYLHEECRHRTVHCDIKPQNILLDAEMQPKIADFGLARLMSRDESKVVTFAKGTPGYMAPEFWRGGQSQLSTKFDVYSYGMVLLELISGQRNFDSVGIANGSSFPVVAFEAAMEGNLESIVDPRLDVMNDVDDVQWQQMKTALFTALWCIQDHPARRPHMSEVVNYLEGAAPISDCPPQPTISISNVSSPPHLCFFTSIGSLSYRLSSL